MKILSIYVEEYIYIYIIKGSSFYTPMGNEHTMKILRCTTSTSYVISLWNFIVLLKTVKQYYLIMI